MAVTNISFGRKFRSEISNKDEFVLNSYDIYFCLLQNMRHQEYRASLLPGQNFGTLLFAAGDATVDVTGLEFHKIPDFWKPS